MQQNRYDKEPMTAVEAQRLAQEIAFGPIVFQVSRLMLKFGIFQLLADRREGLTQEEIIERQLPVPHREMVPVTLEEQIICFADKFFSKTHLDEEKTVEKARKSIAKYGEEGLNRFDGWCSLFL